MRTKILDFKDIQLSTIEHGAQFYLIDELLTDDEAFNKVRKTFT